MCHSQAVHLFWNKSYLQEPSTSVNTCGDSFANDLIVSKTVSWFLASFNVVLSRIVCSLIGDLKSLKSLLTNFSEDLMFIGFDKIFRATLYLRWIPCYLRMAVFELRDFSRCHLSTIETPWSESSFGRSCISFCVRNSERKKALFIHRVRVLGWICTICSKRMQELESIASTETKHVMCWFICQIVMRQFFQGMMNVTCSNVWYIF